MRPTPLQLTGATIAVALTGATAALAAVTARRIIHPRRAAPTQILHVEGDTVTLSNTPLTRHPGVLGLLYDDERHLLALTPHLQHDTARAGITRTLQAPPQPPLQPGVARAIGNVFGTPQELDAAAYEVDLQTQLGTVPAWIFPSPSGAETWLVHLHGSLAGREGALRSVAAVREMGLPSIVPSFRGDPEAPAAPRGAFMLGQTEWEDIEPALDYAADHGAQRIVLIGWSNGAVIAHRLATSSKHQHRIVGIVAISPVLDWTRAIRYSAQAAGLPPLIATLATAGLAAPGIATLLGAPEPLRFRDLTWTTAPTHTLLIHTAGDRTVPYAASVALQRRAPDLVELPLLPPAPHALEWNTDPALFAQLVTRWLESLLRGKLQPPPAV